MQFPGKWMEVNIIIVNLKKPDSERQEFAFSHIYVNISWHKERQKNAVL